MSKLTNKEFIDTLIVLVDSVTEIVELYEATCPYNEKFKEAWLKKAKECLVEYDVYHK